MKRLTKRELSGLGGVHYIKCHKENCHGNCADCGITREAELKLKLYEDLEELGLLMQLPCKVGDNVYCLTSAKTKIVETSILWIEKHSNCLVFALAGGFGDIVSAKLGETWFLTKEEAEQALAKMKEV